VKEDEFYNYLIYHPEVSRINIQFHIAYYTINNYCLGQKPLLNDTTQSDKNIPRLFQFLHNSIENVNIRTYHLNIITMMALVTYDHYQSTSPIPLYEDKRFISILTKLYNNENGHVTNKIVKEYIATMKETATKQNIYKQTIIEFFNLKEVFRAGWLKQGREIDKIKKPESVADHTWGVCLFAQSILNDNIYNCPFMAGEDCSDYVNYDKSHIIMLLLIHDLAESSMGDTASIEDGYKDKTKDEENKFCYYASLDSYPSFNSFRHTQSLWAEFNKRTTINAKIANDIDKLEPFIQLFIYKDLLYQTQGSEGANKLFAEWKDDVCRRMQTMLGKNIYKFLLKHVWESRVDVGNPDAFEDLCLHN
jgi:putative hydrolase of HD superfamily